MKAVFLDRDGVINRAISIDGKPFPPNKISELEIIPGVVEAVRLILSNGMLPVVVTNQPDISRGITSQDFVTETHNEIEKKTGIAHFYICAHDDSDLCNCRKPKPGLLFEAAKDLNLNVQSSYMIGDRWRDVSAGNSAGCTTFFIDYGYDEMQPEPPFIKVESLLEAVQKILEIESAQ